MSDSPPDTATVPKDDGNGLSAKTTYTGMHAVSCTLGDTMVIPGVVYGYNKLTGKSLQLCGHDHSVKTAEQPSAQQPHDHANCDHDHGISRWGSSNRSTPESLDPSKATPDAEKPFSTTPFGQRAKPKKSKLVAEAVAAPIEPVKLPVATTEPARALTKQWLSRLFPEDVRGTMIREIVADTLAVPMTVAETYLAPGVMKGIGQVAAVPMRPLFQLSAHHSAVKWAVKHCVSADSDDAKEFEKRTIDYQIRHLPETVAWTGNAAATFVGLQMLNGGKPLDALSMKAMCMGLSTGVVIGARVLAPAQTEAAEEFTDRHVVHPVSRVVSRALGADHKSIAHAERSEAKYERGEWKDRVQYQRDEERAAQPAL